MAHLPSWQSRSVIQRLAGVDLRSLAAFRMGLGFILLWDLATSLASAGAFYAEAGVMPSAVWARLRESAWIVSLHGLSGSSPWVVTLIIVQMIAAACLLAGWRTQAATLVSWVLLCSLQSRNPVVLHGGDIVLRTTLFWSVFLPLGARWSVDEARGRVSVFTAGGRVFSLASLALLFQTAMIYWFTAALKWGNEWTRDGTAVYYALSVDQFARLPGLWLLQFPGVCRTLTFGVWWLEVLGPFAAFVPWRTHWWRMAVVAAFWGLHLGFALCLRLGPFPWLMMVAWLPFVPSEFWNFVAKPPRERVSGPHDGARDGWMLHGAVHAFVLFCLAYVVLWNLRTTDREKWERWLPMWANSFGHLLRIDQNWALFAPRPLTEDGWLVLEAGLRDGSTVDLIRDGRPLSFDKPARISAEYPDCKWQKLEMNLYLAQYAAVRAPFGAWHATRWNAVHSPGLQVESWTLIYMRELTLPHGFAVTPQRVELWRSGQEAGR
ncbi:MAG: HTTM domain-containing protein [Verrucomicrobiaceae bacterium]|nr:HTTM domain-containing protein [Verrucomicrobiaceae bacterium]